MLTGQKAKIFAEAHPGNPTDKQDQILFSCTAGQQIKFTDSNARAVICSEVTKNLAPVFLWIALRKQVLWLGYKNNRIFIRHHPKEVGSITESRKPDLLQRHIKSGCTGEHELC